MASVFAHDCKPICHRQSIPIASLFSCNKTTKHLNFNTFAKAYIMKCCQLKLNLAPQMKLYILAIDISQITEQSWTNLGVLHTISHIFRISWRILHGSQFWTEIGHKFNYFMRGKCNETVGWEEAKGKFFMLVKQLKIHSITELVKIAKMIVRKIWDCHSKCLEEWAFLVYKKNMYRVKFALKFNKMCYVWLCLCVCVFFPFCLPFALCCSFSRHRYWNVFGNRLIKCLWIDYFVWLTKAIAIKIELQRPKNLCLWSLCGPLLLFFFLSRSKCSIYIYDYMKHWLVSIANSFSWFLSSLGSIHRHRRLLSIHFDQPLNFSSIQFWSMFSSVLIWLEYSVSIDYWAVCIYEITWHVPSILLIFN